jgi:hypothetical protein
LSRRPLGGTLSSAFPEMQKSFVFFERLFATPVDKAAV